MTEPEQKLFSLKENPSKYVKLNVGGSLFSTTIGTLTKYDSMLQSMFSGQMKVMVDADEYVLIDRCGKHFDKILNFLRNDAVALPSTQEGIHELLIEAKYYCIENLVLKCERALKKKIGSNSISSVIITSSENKYKKIINTYTRPIILLLANVVSVSASPDLLTDFNKNVDLFEKFSIEYGGLIKFIKFLSQSGEKACSWQFYDKSEMISEVNCVNENQNNQNRGYSSVTRTIDFPEIEIYKNLAKVFYIISSANFVKDEADDEGDEDDCIVPE